MGYTLDYYKNYLRNTLSKIEDRKKRNQKLKDEIAQLRKAYNRMHAIKCQNNPCADSVRDDSQLKKIAPDVKWRGKYKKDFDEILKDSVKKQAKDFDKSIDQMQDEIMRAIKKKEGEYDTGSFTLNTLNKTRTWLEGVVKNWTN